MANIDDKVVAMSFESNKFESGVDKTLSSLDKLKAALSFQGAGKGLDEFSAASQRVDLGHIATGVDTIADRLGTLRLVAVAAFAEIAAKAVQTGLSLAKSLTLDAAIGGFQEYSTNLNAIQTILANTQASGAGLKDVNAALNQLNIYSDKTIYNFSQMAKNIGTFTAAGVDLKTSTDSIKGIANLAALSGSNADQASTAMYQLSQAIAAGSVKLQDWNSVVNAGMGGTVFQRALAETAEKMGTLKEGTVKLTGPMKNVTIAGQAFRQSLSTPGKASWLTSDVLTTTLKHFTGDLTDAQLAAEGFNKAQIAAIQQTAKTAQHAATEVKTIAQVMDVAKETAGSGWAQTFQIIFGNFNEAKSTFTELSNAINGMINKSAQARNKMLADWKALGGRTELISALTIAFRNLGAIFKPIKEAFRDIFPATTGKNLYNLTLQFKSLAEALKPSPKTIENLHRTFAGLFAVLDIGKQIIGGIFTVFGQLFGSLGENRGGFLAFTASIGDFLVALDKTLKKGDKLHNFFVSLGSVLAAPLKLISAIAHALSDIFSGFDPGGFTGQINGMTAAMTPFQKIMTGISRVWEHFLDTIRNSGQILRPVIEAIANMLIGLGTSFGSAVSNMNFDAILQVIRTGLFAGMVLMFKQFLGKGSLMTQISKGFGKGIVSNVSGSFKALQGSMTALQTNIKAKTLKEIAIAVALLSASVVALSLVDPTKLKGALGAMTVAFGELLGAMAILGNVSKTVGFIKMPIIAASMILLAGAIDTLVIAVVAMSFLSWESLIKGLGGVAALLIGVTAAAGPLGNSSAGLIRAGVGITAIAVAMNLLALAVRQFGSMNLSELAKGLGGVGIGLGIMVAALNLMPTVPAKGAITIIAMAAALNLLARAVQQFSSMSMKELGKGLGSVAIGLGSMVLAMRLMPKNMGVSALQLLALAGAVKIMADAVGKMGAMSIKEIGKGLGTLAGSLVIFALSLHAMQGSVGGAIALGIAATGLTILARAMTIMGKQSWEGIIKSMVSLAGAMVIIGVAAAAMGTAAPLMLAFGVALLAIGGGLALAGAGIFLISTGLSALSVAAPTGIGIIIAAINEFAKAIPEIAKNVLVSLLEVANMFAAVAPKFVASLVKIIGSLLDIIIQSAPKIGEAFTALLTAGIKVIEDNKDQIIQAGIDLILALLQGINNNIGEVVKSATDVIVTFLKALSTNITRIISAGVQLISEFIKGIISGYANLVTAVVGIITKFIQTIASNISKIIAAGVSIITSLLKAISSHILDVVKAGTDIIVAFVKGIGDAGARIVKAARESAAKFVNALATEIPKLAQQVFDALIKLINGMADVIGSDQNAAKMRDAGAHLAYAIINGMTFGLASKAVSVYDKAEEIGKKTLSKLSGIFDINSPSKETMKIGASVLEGLALGLSDQKQAIEAAKAASNSVISAFKDTFEIQSPSRVMIQLGRYVGQGFAQGIRGSSDDIKSAFTDLNGKLTDAMTAAQETIDKEQDKLNKLRAAKKPDVLAIAAAQKALTENQTLLAQSTAAHKVLVTTLKDEETELIGLAKRFETVGNNLAAAKDKLAELRQEKQQTIQGFTDQFSTLPEIVKTDPEGASIDQLSAYLDALKNQTSAVSAYQATLQQLRKLGLDDATYQKLLTEGTADQQFATQLLSGGKTAVDGLNKLDAQLLTTSKRLAVNAANNLKQAGIDAAEGLVKGLQSKHSEIRQEMETIAKEMLAALKKELKIKSPSEAFAEIGRYSMEGMAKGLVGASQNVSKAIEDTASGALNAMKNSMRRASQIISGELNPNPVITPILDLTRLRTQVEEMASLTKVSPITASVSLGQASAISSARTATDVDKPDATPGPTSVTFEQNNYSPEALSEIQIYRQTKSQLSQLKSVLAIP